mgnify:CR=1 FL=1
MKLGIVLGTNEAETCWNAFRLGSTALKTGHEVKVFLINKGVEVEEINDTKFNVSEQLAEFLASKGSILACGTCLKSRQKEGTNTCPISTMKDLLKIIEESDKLVTFG